MTNKTRELIRTDKKGKREKVSFKDHPFTKIMQLMLSADPHTLYRIDAENRQDAKRWGLV